MSLSYLKSTTFGAIILMLAFNAVAIAQESVVGQQGEKKIKLTILYDNYASKPGCQADWGFACLIEGFDKTILFDTGTKPVILLRNIEALGVDVKKVDAIVISHMHRDHTNNLLTILDRKTNIPVYLPASAAEEEQKKITAKGGKVILGQDPQELCPGVSITGEMGDKIKEQALILQTAKGSVVITGCAHPNIVEMVARAQKIGNAKIVLLMGGFHLLQHTQEQVEGIIAQFKALGIDKIGASHCTGEKAIEMIKKAYGEKFQLLGAGAVLEISR